MSLKADKFVPKRVRVQENQVTHELERTVLDQPQLAAERIRGVIEQEWMRLGNTEDARRMKDKVAGFLAGMYQHCDSDLSHEAVLARLVMVLARRNAEMSETITRMCQEVRPCPATASNGSGSTPAPTSAGTIPTVPNEEPR